MSLCILASAVLRSHLSLSRQSIILVLTTKNKETKHPKHKRDTENTTLANKTNYILVWYAFYNLHPGNGVGPIPEHHSARMSENKNIG